jgi:NADH:ubiquinone oxidoreductase subunit
VIYNGEIEASRVSPEWHGWLHKTYENPPSEELVKRKKWEKPHQENLTGSAAAYAPSGSMRSLKAHKNKDYEPWNPQ